MMWTPKKTNFRQGLLMICYMAVLLPATAEHVLCIGDGGAHIVTDTHPCCCDSEHEHGPCDCCRTEAADASMARHGLLALTNDHDQQCCLHIPLKLNRPHIIETNPEATHCYYPAVSEPHTRHQMTAHAVSPKATANSPNEMGQLKTVILQV